MNDGRVGQSDRQHPFEAVTNNRDIYPLSESVRFQEILLHKQLKENIEKSSASRYVNSEIYMRNNQRSPTFDDVSSSRSEIQSTTLDIGGNFTTTIAATNNLKNSKQINSNTQTEIFDNLFKDGECPMEVTANVNESHRQNPNKNCQVCLVREVRHDLMNLNKIIKDRNDQLMTKLKDKRLRSYFERKI